ncbi:MAG: ABC transporter permease, partial [Bacteroidia bacterium]|nr:ABC transporter permease [Bacteroidia bacterium]
MAIDSIQKNKLRSGLTLLGISIGVFSVIGVMTAIRTLESSVASGLNVFATNTFIIQKYPEINFGDRRKFRNRKNITVQQYKKLKNRVKTPLLISAADVKWSRDIKYRDKKIKKGADIFG